MAYLGENCYGKSRVRLVKVTRLADRHEMKEWNVGVYLEGDFESCFTTGDNSRILPTDTMKNTVYFVARNSTAATMEEYAKELVDFLLSRNSQVSSVSVEIAEKPWQHVPVHGAPHPTTFQQSGPEVHTCTVMRAQGGQFSIHAGIRGLVILKTAKSGFTNYIKDELTTLPETRDRLFGTEAEITWQYANSSPSFAEMRDRILRTLLTSFAEHDSLSVQHTLYAMGTDVLEAAAAVTEITLTMPNRHCLLVDLSRLGQDNPNEIFVPIDEPHGYIKARITRDEQ